MQKLELERSTHIRACHPMEEKTISSGCFLDGGTVAGHKETAVATSQNITCTSNMVYLKA